MRSKIETLSIMKKEEERGVLVKLARWAVQRRREWESKGAQKLMQRVGIYVAKLTPLDAKAKGASLPCFLFLSFPISFLILCLFFILFLLRLLLPKVALPPFLFYRCMGPSSSSMLPPQLLIYTWSHTIVSSP